MDADQRAVIVHIVLVILLGATSIAMARRGEWTASAILLAAAVFYGPGRS